MNQGGRAITRGLNTWRVALRMARREVTRSAGRSLLIAVMIGLPVLAASALDVVVRSAQFEPADVVAIGLGDRVQAMVRGIAPGSTTTQPVIPTMVTPSGPEKIPAAEAERLLAAVLPARDRLIRSLTWTPPRWPLLGDRTLPLAVRELDLTDRELAGLFPQLSGRAPQTSGEVVVTASAERELRVHVGDRLALPEPPSSTTAGTGP